MTHSTDLLALEKRLGEAGEGSRELDYLVHETLIDDNARLWNVPAHTTSIDAALALVSRVLPECFWRIGHDGEGPDPASIRADILADGVKHCGTADTPTLALCLALVRALAHNQAVEISEHGTNALSSSRNRLGSESIAVPSTKPTKEPSS